jgi:succinyl-CoA synthetase alpha subunit
VYIHKLLPNQYRDSVSLMQLSASLGKLPGIEQAAAVMATPANLDLLRAAGLMGAPLAASPNDLLLAVRGRSSASLESALAAALAALDKPPERSGGVGPAAMAPRSLQMGIEQVPQANLALISVPGEYAAAEARKALRLGLNVMLFSDNVALADEVALKREARSRGLLVMGPDCGTAVVDGVPLGFANAVRRGAIGVVGASGTGMQQVTSLVHRRGSGISQAIGTGGRDLHRDVGGITMLQGLERLARDPDTKVIVLISKPPAPDVAKAVLDSARRARKPVVVNFVGVAQADAEAALFFARTLEEAANAAVALSKGRKPGRVKLSAPKRPAIKLKTRQRYIRGLYSGGTFCYEACALLPDAWSNAPVEASRKMKDAWKSQGHTVVDLGDDLFTRGRPHPMIDHRLRNERLVAEAADPEVAVILFDVVLGYGAHPDPAAEMLPALAAARKKNRSVAFVASVCGTDEDPQGLGRQESALRAAGVLLAESNARAVMLASALVKTI